MPDSPQLNEAEIKTLGEAFHRGQLIGCPRCGARLHGELRPYNKRSVDVFFYCERCGARGSYEPQDIREGWSDAQWKQICDQYYRHGEARCPFDDAILGGGKDPTQGSHAAHLSCPICGAWRYGDVRGFAELTE